MERITPAYAGRTQTILESTTNKEDHPRMCGKDVVTHVDDIGTVGSPPRAREGQAHWMEATQILRITPARAGRTLTCVEY